MSKSILLIDTPECCDKCRFCCFGNYGAKRCSVKDQSIFLEDKKKKPDWCPLWGLPEKYYPVSMNFESGYNACIDEILKGENENDERTV